MTETYLKKPERSCYSCKFFSRGWDATRSDPGEPSECTHPKCGWLLMRVVDSEKGCKLYQMDAIYLRPITTRRIGHA